MVLNVGKLVGEASAAYYLEKVASGIEDYYLHAGEAPGMWLTEEAGRLGLAGEVVADELMTLLRGEHPRTGERLASRQRAADRMWGWDLTFRAPKSVSLLFALGEDAVRREVRSAHGAAIHSALAYLEREACFGRRRIDGGISPIAAQGFVAAGFQHRTSRAGDPLLHSHVLVANLVHGVDGRWGAIDGRLLYAHAKTAGALYEAELRAQLTNRLGVAWTPVRNGLADIAGVPQAVIRAFSQRRQEIVAHMAARGESSARAAQVATLETRRGKDPHARPEGLLPEWRSRAAALGFGADAIAATMRRSASPPSARAVLEVVDAVLGPDGLTAHASSFSRRDVIVALCDRLPATLPARIVEVVADGILEHPDVVPLGANEDGAHRLRPVAGLRRGDGRVVPGPDERRFSTAELLVLERGLLATALARTNSGAGVAAFAEVSGAVLARPSLSSEQIAMCWRLLLHGDGVKVVRGHAGTGKTFALDACREAWTASGFRVLGCALSARAAAELHGGAGIASSTIHRLLYELEDRPGAPGGAPRGPASTDRATHPPAALDARTVVVVDEAGMVGTRQLARILDHAARAGAAVVLVGDDHQLPEIDAGGAFRGLADRLGAVELTDNRRQVSSWERDALRLLRDGRSSDAISAYAAHGRVVSGEDTCDVRRRIVVDWWIAREDSRGTGGDVVMIANRRSDVRDLNQRARACRVAVGDVRAPELDVPGGAVGVGDEVMCKRNNPHLGVRNGSRGVVTSLDAVERSVTVRLADPREAHGRAVRLPSDYVDAGHLVCAYAVTAHAAQGMTATSALVLVDDAAYREWGYVALSRGRHENWLYVVDGDLSAEARDALHGRAAMPAEPVSAFVASLERSRSQRLAVDEPAHYRVDDYAARGEPPRWRVEGGALGRWGGEHHRSSASSATSQRARGISM